MSVDSISDLAPIPSAAQAFAAPAKLNLDLRITGRRADGYHLLESVFTLIDLCDTVYLLPRHDGQMILHTPTAGVAATQDLAYRAAAALKQASGSPLGVEIWLHKRIPTGGGTGFGLGPSPWGGYPQVSGFSTAALTCGNVRCHIT